MNIKTTGFIAAIISFILVRPQMFDEQLIKGAKKNDLELIKGALEQKANPAANPE